MLCGITRMEGTPLTFWPVSQTPVMNLARLSLTLMCSTISIIKGQILLCSFDDYFIQDFIV